MAVAAAAADGAAAAADPASSALLLVEALLWEQAPRTAVVAAVSKLPADEQQPALVRALASPPPHAPALLPPPPGSSDDGGGENEDDGYSPEYLAWLLAMFIKTCSGAGVDDALASMLQRALLRAAGEAAMAAAASSGGGSSSTTDDPATPLLKTWCVLPPAGSAWHAEALQRLRDQVESRRRRARRRRRRKGEDDRPNAAPAAAAPAPFPSPLVSLRLSPDIFAAGTGATTWAAGFVLAEWLLSRRAAPLVRGRRVLELGSGAGLAGVCAWRAGAARLTLTDADPAALRNCAANVSANLEDEEEEKRRQQQQQQRRRPPPRLLRLQWDEAPRLPEPVASEPDPDDLIIAADVAYDPLLLPGLTRALGALLRRGRGRGQEDEGPAAAAAAAAAAGAPLASSDPIAVVATTVRQEATLALLLDLARREGLTMTEEAEWWARKRRRGGEAGGEAGGSADDAEAEAAAAAAAEDRPWGDDPRFVTVQGLDRRGIKVHVVELVEE